MLTTGEDGRAHWTLSTPLPAPPVIAATPVAPELSDTSTVSAVVEAVTGESVTVRVWRTRPRLGLGLLPSVPAGPGCLVHVVAVREVG